MGLVNTKNNINAKYYYEIPICFNCMKTINLKNAISSSKKDNYRYIICNCGQIMKVVENKNEENISRINRNGKEVKEAYNLFFVKEYKKENSEESKESGNLMLEAKGKIQGFIKKQKNKQREKRKSKLNIIK